MKLAGTDLENYQRFLREAETIRYDEAGLLAYYTFHLTYAPPSALDARPVFEP